LTIKVIVNLVGSLRSLDKLAMVRGVLLGLRDLTNDAATGAWSVTNQIIVRVDNELVLHETTLGLLGLRIHRIYKELMGCLWRGISTSYGSLVIRIYLILSLLKLLATSFCFIHRISLLVEHVIHHQQLVFLIGCEHIPWCACYLLTPI
jgi:hypothetical protein